MGRPIKIDFNTATTMKGKSACICIEIDLSKPLIPRFKLRKHVHSVEYEYFSSICFDCGRVGHKLESCNQASMAMTSKKTTIATAKTSTIKTCNVEIVLDQQNLTGNSHLFGPWIIVNRRGLEVQTN